MPTTTNIDLVSLLEQITPFRSTGTANNNLNGIEHWGMCVFCGGTDRFHAFPYAPKPHWFCRVCRKTGDAIDVLRHFKGLSYVESCEYLGVSPGDSIQHEAPLFFDDDPPCKEWQLMGMTLVDKAQAFLWDRGHEALAYLLKRGFSEATIRAAQLGYVPLGKDGTWYSRPFSDWGLTPEMLSPRQLEKGCVKIPNGILIPWTSQGQTYKLAVKRFEAGPNEPRYGQVLGSKDALYNTDSLARGKPVLLLEGELDVLSAQQECSDLVAPIGTGSTDKGRAPLWIARLASQASTILLGFDNDDNEAGDKASNKWLEILPNALRWPPLSHDVNQMLQEGKNIKKWIVRGLGLATVAPVVEEVVVVMPEPSEAFPVWLARIEQELDVLPQEELWCCQCDGDMDSYTPEMKPLCARCWDAWQDKQEEEIPLPFECGSDTIEAFARHVATIGADLFDCTVTIIPRNYTLAQHVAFLYPQKAKTWADFRTPR